MLPKPFNTFPLLSKTVPAIAILLAVLFLDLFGQPAPVAQAMSTMGEYVVKLAADANVLKGVGHNVEKRFAFSSDPSFEGIYTFSSSMTLGELRSRFAGQYDYLEPVRTLETDAIVLNDPGYTDNAQDIDKTWGLAKAGFPAVWEKTTGSKDTVVAIVDTGIDATHEDLSGVSWIEGRNFLTGQKILFDANSDDNGHGTLIAGVLAATPNNNHGIVGTNWQITLMPLKALDKDGKGDSPTIAEAIVWAADHGADIINLSLGGIGLGHDTVLADSIAHAFNAGAVIIAAAGNDVAVTGGNLDLDPVYPICDDNNANMIIGVVATDANDLKPEFSNFGRSCVDVSAPGRRILSTINYDPFSKQYAPNAYAYASGTSLAVPFVSGQAALIKALYPNATNKQIRDRIVSTADSIDQLNITQCNGKPCTGLLGAGRINVVKSLATPIADESIKEGELVKVMTTNVVYYIVGGRKRPVSTFVMNQRFLNTTPRLVTEKQLENFPEGPYTTPVDGTLVKLADDNTVYVISKGLKLPITYQIFLQRGYAFSTVQTVSFSELYSWVSGTFQPPLDGTLVKAAGNPTVYWVVGDVLHPINSTFYNERGLNIFPIMVVSDKDMESFPKGEAYIR